MESFSIGGIQSYSARGPYRINVGHDIYATTDQYRVVITTGVDSTPFDATSRAILTREEAFLLAYGILGVALDTRQQ
jgi:hypothetical protein